MPFHRFLSPRLIGSVCALLLAGTGSAVLAQAAGSGAVRPAAPVSGNAAAATAGSLPSPSGLRSPLISPGGLTTQPPAGLPVAPSGSSGAGTPLPTTSTASGGGFGNGGPDGYGSAGPATNVLGGPGSGNPAFPARGPYATVDVARSFLTADSNRDGELSRSEAQRLMIAPFSFEEMDRDGNGAVSRGEYQDAVR